MTNWCWICYQQIKRLIQKPTFTQMRRPSPIFSRLVVVAWRFGGQSLIPFLIQIIPEEQYEVEDMQEEVVVEEEENPEVLDTEEQEEFHDVDDTHSDVPSDFEVIPLPECFDTSKPLGSLEKAEQEGT